MSANDPRVTNVEEVRDAAGLTFGPFVAGLDID
jgi:hypothetical protein